MREKKSSWNNFFCSDLTKYVTKLTPIKEKASTFHVMYIHEGFTTAKGQLIFKSNLGVFKSSKKLTFFDRFLT